MEGEISSLSILEAHVGGSQLKTPDIGLLGILAQGRSNRDPRVLDHIVTKARWDVFCAQDGGQFVPKHHTNVLSLGV